MNITLIPLLIAALMLATTDSDVDTTEVILSGQHQIEDHRGALIIGEAQVSIPAGADVPGPIYVIGGDVDIAGTIDTDLVQLAGTVTVAPGAEIGNELRHIGGTQSVSPDSLIGRRTSLDLSSGTGSPATNVALNGVVTMLLAWIGSRFARRRPALFNNVIGAAVGHPLVSITVGTLATLTALALFVFMAFTLVLIPIALVGILAGVLTLGYAVIAWGDLIGRRLPIERRGLATGLGIIAVVLGLQVASRVPVIGELIVFGALLTGVGAVAITYYGLTEFRPDALPD